MSVLPSHTPVAPLLNLPIIEDQSSTSEGAQSLPSTVFVRGANCATLPVTDSSGPMMSCAKSILWDKSAGEQSHAARAAADSQSQERGSRQPEAGREWRKADRWEVMS